jgi:urease accessory protein
LSAPARLARAQGRATLGLVRRGEATALADLGEEGCARVRLPRVAGAAPEAVLINTAGGLTDDDRLDVEVTLGDGARATVTTQAAEKVYRSRGAPSRVATAVRLGAGATLAWLPQETILFDHARLVRRQRVELGPGARFLACESVVLGRLARGERIRSGLVHDAWRVLRQGRLIWADALRLEGDIESALHRPALLDGRRAVATAFYVGEDAATLLEPVRGWLPSGEVRAGVSHRAGVLVMRLLADAAQALRATLACVMAPLRAAIGAGAAAMPRVWGC